jgi:hypothetical protein
VNRRPDTPRPRSIRIAFDGITDEDYNAIANALWAVIATAKADGNAVVYPDRKADLNDLNDVWEGYSETEWTYDPDDDETSPRT